MFNLNGGIRPPLSGPGVMGAQGLHAASAFVPEVPVPSQLPQTSLTPSLPASSLLTEQDLRVSVQTDAFSDLVQRDPHSYDPNIGNRFNFFEIFQSPGQSLDAALSGLNHIGVKIERPVGEVRDPLLWLVFGLGMLISNYVVFKDYSRLMLRSGVEKWTSAIKAYGTVSIALYFLQRAVVDIPAGGKLNTDLIYSYFVVWMLWSGAWAMTVPLSTALSGPFIAMTMGKNVRRQKAIAHGGTLHSADTGTLNEFVMENVEEETGRKNKSVEFTVDAEFLADKKNRVLAKKLKGKRARLSLEGIDNEKLETFAPLMRKLSRDDRFAITATATQIKYLKNKNISGDGIVVQPGSVIEYKKGKTRKLYEPLELKDLELKPGETIRVIKGSIIKTSPVNWSNRKSYYGVRDADFDIHIEGDAAEVLGELPERLANRTLSDGMIPVVNQLFFGLRRYTSLPLMQVLHLIPSFGKSLRALFMSTAVSVKIELPDVAQDQANDVSNEDLENILPLAAQKRFVASLSQNPSVFLTVAGLESRKESGQNKVVLSIPQKSFLKYWNESLRLSDDWILVKIPGTSSQWASVLPDSPQKGYWRVEADIEILLEELKKYGSEIKKQAMEKVGLFGMDRAIMLELPNPSMEANKIWKMRKEEILAKRAGAGSSRSEREVNASHRPRFFSTIFGLTPGAMRYGRFPAIAGLTMSSGVWSFGLIGGEKWATGFDDWVVLFTSSSRTLGTSGFNRIFGPGILEYVGESGYSSMKYFTPGMILLSLWEIPNEAKEAKVLLFDSILQSLLGEDRPAQRLEKTTRLKDMEIQIATVRPQSKVRKAILYKRLANYAPTGVQTAQDAMLLMEMYQEGQRGKTEGFEAAFLAAVAADAGMRESISRDQTIADFFNDEAEKYGPEMVKLLEERGLSFRLNH